MIRRFIIKLLKSRTKHSNTRILINKKHAKILLINKKRQLKTSHIPTIKQILNKGIFENVIPLGATEQNQNAELITPKEIRSRKDKIRKYLLQKYNFSPEYSTLILSFIINNQYLNCNLEVINIIAKYASSLHSELIPSREPTINIPNSNKWVKYIVNNQLSNENFIYKS